MEDSPDRSNGKVLVIGGGVGGIKTALDLAEAERDVILIDKAPSLGGLMTQLDRTFPTNNCDMCTVSPHLAASGRELHISLKLLTELTACTGEAGGFQVTLQSRPRYIDLDKCTACGDCLEKFPKSVRFTPGLDARAPTCMRYPQATPQAYWIDIDRCSDINEVAAVCRHGAIKPDDRERTEQIEVGAIVLAPGAALYNGPALSNYGYGVFPNVVTGLEYERLMSASGPTGGELIRPSDGRRPQKVAWIQCAGSRNLNQSDLPYCSSVCCMYALKEAMITKERFVDDVEAVVFYMDMRTSGKDYELFLERAQKDYQVQLVRCRPHSVESVPGSDDLSITYITEGSDQQTCEVFDLVVLSVGFHIPPDLAALARKLDLELNEHSFIKTDTFRPVAASRPGIYVCGLFQSPKDIPETMVQASACAGLADAHLDRIDPDSDREVEDWPPERDVSFEEPRIGVFICDCGENIGGVIDVAAVAEYAAGLPHVAASEMIGHGCSNQAMEEIERTIRDFRLNRVVIGGCSPRTHETKFQDAARRAGLNKYLVEMANLRDQDTWVHADQPKAAADKAKDLIRMAVAGVSEKRALSDQTLPVSKDVLVVGGGVAGMSAALNLAASGYSVFLVERSPVLGGLAWKVRRTLEGDDVGALVHDLSSQVMSHQRIQVLTDSLVVDHYGLPGMFTTGVQNLVRMTYRQIRHGVTVLATGAQAGRPREYLLDQHRAVITQMDLDNLLADDPKAIESWRQVVMIQCVGSRIPENPNCSRICCQAAVKNALRIKELSPETNIIVLNRDLRTSGFQEDYYRLAREKGVIFVRYDLNSKPLVAAGEEGIIVSFKDTILDREISLLADCLVLSTGLVPEDESNEELASIFKLPRTADGYFLEEHIKLSPVDLPAPGFLVAGTAHAPKTIGESIGQGLAAAGRAKALLSKDNINLGAAVAKVERIKCAACLICVRACPFEVPFINADGYSEINPAKCHGCGICASECPAKAIQLMKFEDDLILAQLTGLLEGVI